MVLLLILLNFNIVMHIVLMSLIVKYGYVDIKNRIIETQCNLTKCELITKNQNTYIDYTFEVWVEQNHYVKTEIKRTGYYDNPVDWCNKQQLNCFYDNNNIQSTLTLNKLDILSGGIIGIIYTSVSVLISIILMVVISTNLSSKYVYYKPYELR